MAKSDRKLHEARMAVENPARILSQLPKEMII